MFCRLLSRKKRFRCIESMSGAGTGGGSVGAVQLRRGVASKRERDNTQLSREENW